MGNSKIQLGDGSVLLDLTGDTVTASTLKRGFTAHNAAGNPIVGTMDDSGGGGSSAPATYDIIGTINNADQEHVVCSNFYLNCDGYDFLMAMSSNSPLAFMVLQDQNSSDPLSAVRLRLSEIRTYADNSSVVYSGCAGNYEYTAYLGACDSEQEATDTGLYYFSVELTFPGTEYTSTLYFTVSVKIKNLSPISITVGSLTGFHYEITSVRFPFSSFDSIELETLCSMKVLLHDSYYENMEVLSTVLADQESGRSTFASQDGSFRYEVTMQVYPTELSVPADEYSVPTTVSGSSVYIGVKATRKPVDDVKIEIGLDSNFQITSASFDFEQLIAASNDVSYMSNVYAAASLNLGAKRFKLPFTDFDFGNFAFYFKGCDHGLNLSATLKVMLRDVTPEDDSIYYTTVTQGESTLYMWFILTPSILDATYLDYYVEIDPQTSAFSLESVSGFNEQEIMARISRGMYERFYARINMMVQGSTIIVFLAPMVSVFKSSAYLPTNFTISNNGNLDQNINAINAGFQFESNQPSSGVYIELPSGRYASFSFSLS